MVKDLYKKIGTGKDIRANLIALKKEIQDQENKRALVYLLAGDFGVFEKLLQHEDAKVRKNAVLILGEMECDELLPVIFKAYEEEHQLFVKSDYLKAMSKYDYHSYLPVLKLHLKELQEQIPEENNSKHIREEICALRTMILRYEKPQKHEFIGYDQEIEVILLTNRNHRQVTKEQVTSDKITMLASGIRVVTKDLKSLLPIRTYTEMLFPIPGIGILKGSPGEMARQLRESELSAFLSERHSKGLPFYYRVEMKNHMSLEKKSIFLKKLTAALDSESNQAFVNATSDYEIELRLIENKEGNYIPLLKLFTLPDTRFSYRQQVISTSISPVNAALFMQLAKPYLKENAQILDPFCGVGTMLTERGMLMSPRFIYGTDIFGEAVEKARENATHTDLTIHYVNCDFFDFQHEHLFDEILTNMPDVTKTKDKGQIIELHEKFFEKIPEILKPDGILLLYSKSPEILRHCLKNFSLYQIIDEWLIQDQGETRLFLIGSREYVSTSLHK